jgi:hypothetical protein
MTTMRPRSRSSCASLHCRASTSARRFSSFRSKERALIHSSGANRTARRRLTSTVARVVFPEPGGPHTMIIHGPVLDLFIIGSSPIKVLPLHQASIAKGYPPSQLVRDPNRTFGQFPAARHSTAYGGLCAPRPAQPSIELRRKLDFAPALVQTAASPSRELS